MFKKKNTFRTTPTMMSPDDAITAAIEKEVEARVRQKVEEEIVTRQAQEERVRNRAAQIEMLRRALNEGLISYADFEKSVLGQAVTAPPGGRLEAMGMPSSPRMRPSSSNYGTVAAPPSVGRADHAQFIPELWADEVKRATGEPNRVRTIIPPTNIPADWIPGDCKQAECKTAYSLRDNLFTQSIEIFIAHDQQSKTIVIPHLMLAQNPVKSAVNDLLSEDVESVIVQQLKELHASEAEEAFIREFGAAEMLKEQDWYD